jgi:hypothetical protein
MLGMSSSDSIDAPSDLPPHPEPIAATDVDPAIAGAVDTVGDRFGVLGLEQMISYAQKALTVARQALDELADLADDDDASTDAGPDSAPEGSAPA